MIIEHMYIIAFHNLHLVCGFWCVVYGRRILAIGITESQCYTFVKQFVEKSEINFPDSAQSALECRLDTGRKEINISG